MQNTRLLDNEIDGINLFISNMEQISSVEGVYILPYISKSREKRFSVVAVFSSKSDFFTSDMANIEEEKKHFNSFFSKERIRFSSQDLHQVPSLENCEWYFFTEQALVSGTILLDKSGKVTEKKSNLEKSIGTSASVIKVDNISGVMTDSSSFTKIKN